MNRGLLVGLILLMTAPVGPGFPPPPKDTKPDADKLARELGDGFAVSLGKRDFEAIVKTVEFPYRTSAGKDTKGAGTVREELDTVVSAYMSENGTTAAVKDVVAPDKFESWADGLTQKPGVSKTESDRKAVLEHVGPDGRIVALQFTVNGKKDEELCLLLVKIKDGKAVLVGVVD